MKFLTTTVLAITSAAAANAWTLYCGDSCTDGTAIVSGEDDYQGASCTDLSQSYDYCYFESEEAWYYAAVYGETGCQAGSDTPGATIEDGACVSAGPYLSYRVVVDL